MRIILSALIAIFGVGSILLHRGFDFSQMQTVDFVVMGGSLVVALLLLVLKPREKSGQPQGIHTFTFPLEQVTSPMKAGQRLYLRPYLGENYDQIGITSEQGEVFGYLPQEYTDYVLSRLEGHHLTRTEIESVEEGSFGATTVHIRITC